jgi:hypothetical protein
VAPACAEFIGTSPLNDTYESCSTQNTDNDADHEDPKSTPFSGLRHFVLPFSLSRVK